MPGQIRLAPNEERGWAGKNVRISCIDWQDAGAFGSGVEEQCFNEVGKITEGETLCKEDYEREEYGLGEDYGLGKYYEKKILRKERQYESYCGEHAEVV